MIGMLAFVIAGLVPTFLMGGNPIVEVVEAGKSDHRLRGASSEAPQRSDGSHCEGEDGSSVPGACTAAGEPLETLSRLP